MSVRLALLAVVVVGPIGCGGQPFPAFSCSSGDLSVQTQEGVSARCTDFWHELHDKRTLFEGQFGATALGHWIVVVSPETNPVPDHSGFTDWERHQVLISERALFRFPHELFHIQLGAVSYNHGEPEWCSELSPWEIEEHLDDERDYLGCPR